MNKSGGNGDHPSLMKKALVEIRDLRSKLETLESARSEPIAIIGLGCRFPGAESPEDFWTLLQNGVDAITEVPSDRWDVNAYYDPEPGAPGKIYSRYGGFLGQVDGFDADFFGISPREARSLSLQQRLLLEIAWETLENANLVPGHLFGSSTGIFVGMCGFDNAPWAEEGSDRASIDLYTLTGSTMSVAAGRLSYALGLTGPSMVVDTACSSSLVATHLACSSLRQRECDLALAGGVNVILSPAMTIGLCRLKTLAPDGRCKTFDGRADGYVRGEGCGMVALKRLSDALRDEDQVLALIRGSAVNQDGSSGGLTVPSGPSQRTVIRRALEDAGVDPLQVGYVETHGTGTVLGDPIEVGALETLCRDRLETSPLVIGSVKTNVGHLEAAAGIAGLLKVVLSLQNEKIPPHLHFETPNPHIPWDRLPISVASELLPWPRGETPRIAGVSSFGLSGTNAHLVVEEPPREERLRKPGSAEANASCRAQTGLLPISARSPEALRSMADRYREWFADAEHERYTLLDVCYTASVRRTHHNYRMAVVARSHDELNRKMLDPFAPDDTDIVFSERNIPEHAKRLAFVFSGQGSHWFDVGRELLDSETVFRRAMEKSDASLRELVDWSLLEELSRGETLSRLEEPEVAQPAFFALQVALATLWQSWGVVPDAVVGHSLGEVAAAHVAGALNFEEALRVVYHRGRLLQRETGHGAMLSVALPLHEVERELSGYGDHIEAAAVNSPTSVILSGDASAIQELSHSLERRDVLCRKLSVRFAAHSRKMEPYRIQLSHALEGLRPRSLTIPMLSTVTGDTIAGEQLDGDYWGRNVRETVLFASAIDKLLERGFSAFVEIGPHPMLADAISRCADHREREVSVVASLRRGQEDRRTMLKALGMLYVNGHAVDWQNLFPSHARCAPLPTYAWDRKRFSVARAGGSFAAPRRGIGSAVTHPLLGERLFSPLPSFEAVWNLDAPPFLDDHRISGTVIVTAATYVETLLAAAMESFGAGCHGLGEIAFHQAFFLPESDGVTVQVIITPQGPGVSTCQIFSTTGPTAANSTRWTLHASGVLRRGPSPADEALARQRLSLQDLKDRCPKQISGSSFYEELGKRGIEVGPRVRPVRNLWLGDHEALGEIHLPSELQSEAASYHVHPVLLSACLDTLGAMLPESRGNPVLLSGVSDFRFHRRAGSTVWSHVSALAGNDSNGKNFRAAVSVFDDSGELVARATGLQLSHVRVGQLVYDAAVANRDQVDIRTESASRNITEASEAMKKLQVAHPRDRQELLTSFLQQDVARVLERNPEQPVALDQGFFNLGMDSLTAMELKRRAEARLGVSLPDTVVFNYPSIQALGDYLLTRFWPSEALDGNEIQADVAETASAAFEEEEYTEDELIDQLAKKLEAGK